MPARNSPLCCVRLLAVWAASPGARTSGNAKNCATGAVIVISTQPNRPTGRPCRGAAHLEPGCDSKASWIRSLQSGGVSLRRDPEIPLRDVREPPRPGRSWRRMSAPQRSISTRLARLPCAARGCGRPASACRICSALRASACRSTGPNPASGSRTAAMDDGCP